MVRSGLRQELEDDDDAEQFEQPQRHGNGENGFSEGTNK
jgi:hypothetical protein